eukprot:1161744-Pelagomonas_calceolata.AAC.15
MVAAEEHTHTHTPAVLALELLLQCLDLRDILLAHQHCTPPRDGVCQGPHLKQHPSELARVALTPPQLREPAN